MTWEVSIDGSRRRCPVAIRVIESFFSSFPLHGGGCIVYLR
jgi:hypothetical protein